MINGHFPYEEKKGKKGEFKFGPLYFQMQHNNNVYWNLAKNISNRSNLITEEFMSLINVMLSEKPENRPSVDNLLENDFLNEYEMT